MQVCTTNFVNKIINPYVACTTLLVFVCQSKWATQAIKYETIYFSRFHSWCIFLHLIIQHMIRNRVNVYEIEGSTIVELRKPDQRLTMCNMYIAHANITTKRMLERSHFVIVSYVKFLNSGVKRTLLTYTHTCTCTQNTQQPSAKSKKETWIVNKAMRNKYRNCI